MPRRHSSARARAPDEGRWGSWCAQRGRGSRLHHRAAVERLAMLVFLMRVCAPPVLQRNRIAKTARCEHALRTRTAHTQRGSRSQSAAPKKTPAARLSKYQESGKSRARGGACVQLLPSVEVLTVTTRRVSLLTLSQYLKQRGRAATITTKRANTTERLRVQASSSMLRPMRWPAALEQPMCTLFFLNNFNRFSTTSCQTARRTLGTGGGNNCRLPGADAQTRAHSETTARCALLACTRG